MLAPAQAVDALLAPDAVERWSVLAGEPVLLIDFGAEGGRLDPARSARATPRLSELPSVTVALVEGPASPAADPLAAACDVAVATAQLEGVLAAVRRNPLASLALVQLLRHGQALDVPACLFAESLVYSTLQAGPEFRDWLARRKPPRPRPSFGGVAVRVERNEGRLVLTLGRPEKRNAFSVEMRDAFCEALALAAADRSIGEVVLRGEGPDFCSGGDLDEFGTFPDPATAHAIRSTRGPARWLWACAERARAEVHGACIGAGAELPAFCRRVRATEDAYFQLPEVSMGLVPGAGGTASLPRRIGRQRTAYLALTGARLEAAAALRWGLVDEIHSPPARS